MWRTLPRPWRRWWPTTSSPRRARTGSTARMPTCASRRIDRTVGGELERPGRIPAFHGCAMQPIASVPWVPVLRRFLRFGDLLRAHFLLEFLDGLLGVHRVAMGGLGIGRRKR